MKRVCEYILLPKEGASNMNNIDTLVIIGNGFDI